MRKIVTDHVYPPIPLRDCDWCAWFDGEEENGPYGWGPTEATAIDDLVTESGDDGMTPDEFAP